MSLVKKWRESYYVKYGNGHFTVVYGDCDLHSHHASFCTPSLAGIRLLPVAKAVVASGCKKGFVTLVSCHIWIT